MYLTEGTGPFDLSLKALLWIHHVTCSGFLKWISAVRCDAIELLQFQTVLLRRSNRSSAVPTVRRSAVRESQQFADLLQFAVLLGLVRRSSAVRRSGLCGSLRLWHTVFGNRSLRFFGNELVGSWAIDLVCGYSAIDPLQKSEIDPLSGKAATRECFRSAVLQISFDLLQICGSSVLIRWVFSQFFSRWLPASPK